MNPVQMADTIFRDEVSVIKRGENGRFYVFDAATSEGSDGWWSNHNTVAGALASARNTREFWDEKEQMKDSPRIVRADGGHYYIGAKGKKQGTFRGFGGAKWRIEFTDGRIVETDNLWSNGTIPLAYRERLPDNAVLISLPSNAVLTREGEF